MREMPIETREKKERNSFNIEPGSTVYKTLQRVPKRARNAKEKGRASSQTTEAPRKARYAARLWRNAGEETLRRRALLAPPVRIAGITEGRSRLVRHPFPGCHFASRRTEFQAGNTDKGSPSGRHLHPFRRRSKRVGEGKGNFHALPTTMGRKEKKKQTRGKPTHNPAWNLR